jgi:hypothetical protein
MAAYAGTTTLMGHSTFGNKKVSVLKVDITNYNATGIPLTKAIAGLNVIEVVIPYVTGGAGNAAAPVTASYIDGSNVVYLYHAVDHPVHDDLDLNALSILVYLLVVGV